MTSNQYGCPYCHALIDLGNWSPYTSEERSVKCLCGRVATIEWDDDNGWYAWLSTQDEMPLITAGVA